MKGDAARYTIYSIVLANVVAFLNADRDRFGRWFGMFSVVDGSLQSMLRSMFAHQDAAHLLGNMLVLLRYSTDVFVNTTSRTWNSPLAVLSVYLGSGFGGDFGTIALARLFESQWSRRIRESRNAARATCTHWLCDSLGLNYLSRPAADLYTHLFYAGEAAALWRYKLVRRIGASSAVYGVVGARLYLTLVARSPWHRPLDPWDAIILAGNVAHELSQQPLTLARLSEGLAVADNVDHAGHIFGLATGALLAAALHRFAKWKDRGGGRRLGRR